MKTPQTINESEVVTPQSELAKHHKTVYEFVISLDMQQEMLDILLEENDEPNWTAWGKLSHALSSIRDIERGYTL